MNVYTTLACIISLIALLGYVNVRFIKLPMTIAIMGAALLLSMGIVFLGHHGFHNLEQYFLHEVGRLDFQTLLLQGMLSFLLFAGASTVNVEYLKVCQREILLLASVSTVLSTLLIGYSLYYCLPLVSIPMPLLYCFLFGALISPTDPIAVLAIFKQMGAPKRIHVTVAGESLFNDGVGIVIFLTLYQLTFNHEPVTVSHVSFLFLKQAVGGIAYGIILGVIGNLMIKSADDRKLELLITLSMTTAGYLLAERLGISGPLAMVAAGIFLGNSSKRYGLSKKSRQNLDTFWEVIDEVLNAVLFFMMGLELLVVATQEFSYLIGLLVIPLVLLVRYITVAIPITLMKFKNTYPPHFINLLVWGGLRGGLGVALALSLPNNKYKSILLVMTYSVVVFSILIQGTTMKTLVRKSKVLDDEPVN